MEDEKRVEAQRQRWFRYHSLFGDLKLKTCLKHSEYLSDFDKTSRLLEEVEGKEEEEGLRKNDERFSQIIDFIIKYRNSSKSETSEDSFVTNLAKRPINTSLSQILSQYYTANYGFDMKVIDLEPICCQGEPAYLRGGAQVHTYHINFRASIEDDDDDHSHRDYFAELMSYSFSPSSPFHCKVMLSVPVDASNNNNACICSLGTPHESILHPGSHVFADPLILPARPASLYTLASIMVPQFPLKEAWTESKTRLGVFFFPTVPVMANPPTSLKRRIPSVVKNPEDLGDSLVCLPNAKQQYFYCRFESSKRIEMKFFKMTIPHPKEKLSIEGESKDIFRPTRQDLALAMAKVIENYDKPSPPSKDPIMEKLLNWLPICHMEKYGFHLEGVTNLKFQHSAYMELRRSATLFHMNFNAKRLDGGGDDSVKLYFAEVVMIEVHYPPKSPFEYIMVVCVAVDENDPAGNSSKCRMCSQLGDVQICHPDPDLYDSSCMLDPCKFKFWKTAAEFLESKFPLI